MLENPERLIAIKNSQCTGVAITEESYIGSARRQAVTIADRAGFSKTEIDKIAIIINELGSNLIKHANKTKVRQLLFQVVQVEDQQIFEIIALDKGPGLVNITQCLQDGYSTVNTSGNGLGAVKRLSDYFNIYSVPELGTIVLAHIYFRSNAKVSILPSFNISGICVPMLGEEISGDNWLCHQSSTRCIIILADGLGHGPDAAKASQLACEVFQKNSHLSPLQIIYLINAELQHSRGAAVSIAEIDKNQQLVKFAGLGNVSGNICHNKKVRHMVTHDGTAGVSRYKIQEYLYPWNNDALLLMHSDGLISRCSLDHYPGLSNRHLSITSGVLYRDFCRGTDDTTVVVARDKNRTTMSNNYAI